MTMNCERFEARLDDYLDGRLSDIERRAADEHLAQCDACTALLRTLGDMLANLPATTTPGPQPDALLTSAIVERTSGSPCERAQGFLVELVDGALGSEDTSLVRSHLEHCTRCAALHGALQWLGHELPAMAEIDPGPAFTRGVVASTAGRPAARPQRGPAWREAAAEWWVRMVARPRFAWEAAYVALLVLVVLFGTSVSPFRGVPSRALAIVQLDPRSAVRAVYEGVDTAGRHAWDASAGRIARGAREQAGTVADRHPGMHESYGNLQLHWGELQQSTGDRNFASASLALGAMGHDLRALWSALTGSPPAEPPH